MAEEFIYVMQNVTKVYPPSNEVIKDMSLQFYPGAKIGVIGYNGAGKSTLLRIMAAATLVTLTVDAETGAGACCMSGYLGSCRRVPPHGTTTPGSQP